VYPKPLGQANNNLGDFLEKRKKAELKFLSNLPIKGMKLSNVLNIAGKGGAQAKSRFRMFSSARMQS
jgi:hypothetical protein